VVAMKFQFYTEFLQKKYIFLINTWLNFDTYFIIANKLKQRTLKMHIFETKILTKRCIIKKLTSRVLTPLDFVWGYIKNNWSATIEEGFGLSSVRNSPKCAFYKYVFINSSLPKKNYTYKKCQKGFNIFFVYK
jgi:hypothetical protein